MIFRATLLKTNDEAGRGPGGALQQESALLLSRVKVTLGRGKQPPGTSVWRREGNHLHSPNLLRLRPAI